MENQSLTQGSKSLNDTSVDGRTSQTGRCSISVSEASESVKMEVNHPEYQTIQEGVTLADGAVIDITSTVLIVLTVTRREVSL